MLSWVITSANLNWASQVFLTRHHCVCFRKKLRAHFYRSSPRVWAPATRTLINQFISWSCFCPEFLSSTLAAVLCLSQSWSINNKLNGCMQAGGPHLWNVKGLYHYSWQLLICSPVGQSPQIIGTQFHAIITVSGAQGVNRAMATTIYEKAPMTGKQRSSKEEGCFWNKAAGYWFVWG